MQGANFLAIDVETANQSPGSICQIGGCLYVDGEEKDSFSWLINPEDAFDARNIAVHGITEAATARHAAFHEIQAELVDWLDGSIIISHGSFDKTALTAAFSACGDLQPSCRWVDSCDIVRAAWPAYASRGYGLKPTAERLGITFNHHDALEDARTAGLVVLAAMRELGLSFDELLTRYARAFGQPVPSRPRAAKRPPNRPKSHTLEITIPPILPILSPDEIELLACYAAMPDEMKRAYLKIGVDAAVKLKSSSG